jgi:hypothetical protein
VQRSDPKASITKVPVVLRLAGLMGPRLLAELPVIDQDYRSRTKKYWTGNACVDTFDTFQTQGVIRENCNNAGNFKGMRCGRIRARRRVGPGVIKAFIDS